MRSISRLTLLVILIVSVKISFSQQNLAEIFDKWKDGEYKYFRNWGDQELNMVEETMHKAKVTFSKNSKTGFAQISFTGTNDNGYYEHIHQGETDFVRYYSDGYDKRLHLTGNSIIIYKLVEKFDKIEMKILGCIGKKIGQKDATNLKTYLEETKKYWIPKYPSEASDQIVSIKATPIFEEGQTSVAINKNFTIGIEVEYSWGMKAKTRNLNGSMKSDIYNVVSKDVTYVRKEEYLDNKITLTPDCRFIKNNVLKLVGKVANKEFTLELPLNCDADNSPAIVYARKLGAYDVITISVKNGDKYESKTYENESGFLHCSTELYAIYKENEKSKNYLIRVEKGDKLGWADLEANLVIPMEYEGGSVGLMSDNIITAKKNGKWGFINFQNKAITAFKYDNAGKFKNGFGYIELDKKQGQVNAKGIEVVKPEYDEVWSFKNGAIVVKKGNLYGFIRENGTIIGSINHQDAFDFNSYGYGAIKDNGKYGIIDLAGNTILPVEYPSIPEALDKEFFKVKKDGKFALVNKAGKFLTEYEYYNIFSPGKVYDSNDKLTILVFRVECGYFGYIKSDGSEYLPCKYSEAGDFSFGGQADILLYEDGMKKRGRYSSLNKGEEWYEETPMHTDETSSTTTKKSNSSTKAVSDKKTIKNTGRKILHLGADGTTGYNINAGSSREFPCRQKIYYTYHNGSGYNGKGPVVSEAKEDCGETINANGDQYHKN